MRHALFAVMVALACSHLTRAEVPATSGSSTRVLLLPFEAIAGESEATAAIAAATSRSLAVDLSRIPGVSAISGKDAATDRDTALEKANAENAKFVVWGTTQFIEGRVRVLGDVLDVQSGETVGQFKVTGTLRELFEIQDLVTEQVRRRIKAPATASDDGVAQEPAEEVPTGKPLRITPDRNREPAWASPRPAVRDEITQRYNRRYVPDWAGPYYTPSYGFYRHRYGRLYGSNHRPLGYRMRDYYYAERGFPDSRLYTRYGPISGFHGPVPLHWLHVD